MANEAIKNKAKESGVKLWQVAEKLEIADFNFSRKLRKELPEDERIKIFGIIDDIAKEGKNGKN